MPSIINNETEQEELEEAFRLLTDLEEYVLDYGQHHLNQTTSKILVNGEHAGEWNVKLTPLTHE